MMLKHLFLAIYTVLTISPALAQEGGASFYQVNRLSHPAAALIQSYNQTDDGFILTTSGVLSNGRLTPYVVVGYSGGPFFDIPKAFARGGMLGLTAFGSGEPAAVLRNGQVIRLPQSTTPQTDSVVDIDRHGNVLSLNRIAGVIAVHRTDLSPWWSARLGQSFVDAAFLPDGRVLVSSFDTQSSWYYRWAIVSSNGSVTHLPEPAFNGLNDEFEGNQYSGYITKVTASGCFPFVNTNGYFCLGRGESGELLRFIPIATNTRLFSFNDRHYGTGYSIELGNVLVLPNRSAVRLESLMDHVPLDFLQRFSYLFSAPPGPGAVEGRLIW